MTVLDKDKIIMLLRSKGPLVSNDIKKFLKADPMLLGAVLSDLSSRNFVKITKLKKGSSPFYYLPGQEKLLEKLLEYINPKDQQTVLLLQREKVIQEATQEMFVRVSLRNIPDYVRPFMLQTSQGPYRFWRYYLVPEPEAIQLLKDRHNKAKEEPKQEVVQQAQAQEKTEIQKQELPKEETHKEPEPEKETSKEQPIQQEVTPLPIQKKTSPKPKPKPVPLAENQQSLSIEASLEKTPFYEKIINYFNEKDIVLLSEEMLSKDREYAFTIKLPTSVGYLTFYVHARNKKKLNEGDVAPALLKAKTKDMSCLFLTNGEFTKKSLALMETEYKGLVIKHLK